MDRTMTLRLRNLSRLLFGSSLLLSAPWSLADQAVLLEQSVLVAMVKEAGANPSTATYKSQGNWVVTGRDYIDATVAMFDFGAVDSVSRAVLELPLEALFPHGGAAHLQVFAYGGYGSIHLGDFSAGSRIPVAQFDAVAASGGNSNALLSIDVTGVTNALLASGSIVGYRIVGALQPSQISDEAYPAFRGARFGSIGLDYTPGSAPVLNASAPEFDGYVLSLPGLSAPGVGAFNVSLKMIDSDAMLFQLHSAEDIGPPGLQPGNGFTGSQLLDCNAFSAPPGSQALLPGAPVFSPLTGQLDIPQLRHDGRQYHAQLQMVQEEPMLFSLLSVEETVPGPSDSSLQSIAEIGGSLDIEPSQDFIPLCHGWILIGDTSRNSLVERNVITGATGRIYPFNTTPDLMMLDAGTASVYMTTQPESERLYRLDLVSGQISYNTLRENGRRFIPRALAQGEDGNIFSLLYDPYHGSDSSSPAANGMWLSVLDPQGGFVRPSLPLDSPVRIEYDRVRNNVFLANESNLATFHFDPATQELYFAPDTDIPVGQGCTDFSVSPDGYRLAYSCPNGNAQTPRNSIVDMNPVDYYDADGEWKLEASPLSATFSADGDTLIATDGRKLYFFNVYNHLLREAYNLDLPTNQRVKKIRLSRDGKLLYVFLHSKIGDAGSTIHWLAMPEF